MRLESRLPLYSARGLRRFSLNEHRLHRVDEAFASLSERYRGSELGSRVTFHVQIVDLGSTWQVDLDRDSCTVTQPAKRKPDTVIETDARTWLALRDGRISGLDAFAERRLRTRGNVDLALAFEGMFSLPGDRPPRISVHDVKAGDQTISTLTAGSGGQRVLLLHGLGGTKSSFFPTVAALSHQHTVHALDFPGFGASSKPSTGAYNAEWFAQSVLAFMDELGIESAHLVGNSMGGRVAIEAALSASDRISSLSLLTPALAWRRHRQFLPIVKLLSPKLAGIPHPLLKRVVRQQIKGLFADPSRIDPDVIEVGAIDFSNSYRSRGARIAFAAAARNIYLDAPFGNKGFWTRLAQLQTPSLFVFGDHDTLVPAKFARHVCEILPQARCVTLENCGHVPQIELPDQTNKLIRQHIGHSADLGSSIRRWAMKAAS